MKPKDMLMQFSLYGVKKTSMEDIARAAGLSRQSIYKKFGSKKGVLEWVLATFIEDVVNGAVKALSQPVSCNPKETVLKVFECWSGELAPIISNTPHGAEILETGMRFAVEDKDWESELMGLLADYLIRSGLCDDKSLSIEQARALNFASKGIMLKTQTAQEFSQEMMRVIQVIFRG